jgi:hypothetical protein
VETHHHALVLQEHALDPQALELGARLVLHDLHQVGVDGGSLRERDRAVDGPLGSVDPPYLDSRSEPGEKLVRGAPRDDRKDPETTGEKIQPLRDAGERSRVSGELRYLGQSPVEVEEEPGGPGRPKKRLEDARVAFHRSSVVESRFGATRI